MEILTINEAARKENLPPHMLRSMVKRGECPGFYSGSRFYVNMALLREKLEQDSRSTMSNRKEAAQ